MPAAPCSPRCPIVGLTVLVALLCCLSACGGSGHSFLVQNFPPLEQSREETQDRLLRFADALRVGDLDRAMSFTSRHVFWRSPLNGRGYNPTRAWLANYSAFVITYEVLGYSQHQDTATLTINLTLTATAAEGNPQGNLSLTGTQSIDFFYENEAWLISGIFSTPPPD